MAASVKVIGADKVIGAMKAKQEQAKGAVSLALERVAMLFRDTVVDKYVGGGHPDYPQVVTGRLKSSIRYQMQSWNKAKVGSDADYAIFVEYGHSQEPGRFVPAIGKRLVASSVKPYPFFRPAMTEVFDGGKAKALFARTVKEELRL